MRLINSQSQSLETKNFGVEVFEYAILSHTWGEEEITHQEFVSGNKHVMRKAGYVKILQACKLAAMDGLPYVWVDTCCIDKTSSAELSEAINSMYDWYKAASVCYAYLSDVKSHYVEREFQQSDFQHSRWFKRGWTLQELLAPPVVRFFNSSWTPIGELQEYSAAVSHITSIDERILQHNAELADFSIATRMSWAAKRLTTRIEDQAYCLLGIFDVNMPMLYGEGTKAFLRLQEEIIKISNDRSILAWHNRKRHFGGGCLLAPSVSCFAESKDIVCMQSTTGLFPGLSVDRLHTEDTMASSLSDSSASHSFAFTNAGLEISLGFSHSLKTVTREIDLGNGPQLMKEPCKVIDDYSMGYLHCRYEHDLENELVLNLNGNGSVVYVKDQLDSAEEKWFSRLTTVPRRETKLFPVLILRSQPRRPNTQTGLPKLWVRYDSHLRFQSARSYPRYTFTLNGCVCTPDPNALEFVTVIQLVWPGDGNAIHIGVGYSRASRRQEFLRLVTVNVCSRMTASGLACFSDRVKTLLYQAEEAAEGTGPTVGSVVDDLEHLACSQEDLSMEFNINGQSVRILFFLKTRAEGSVFHLWVEKADGTSTFPGHLPKNLEQQIEYERLCKWNASDD